MSPLSVIEIGIDPTIELGPITLAWHGITIAVGIVIGGLATARHARERGLDIDRLSTLGLLLVVFGLVGARLLYLIESGDIADPGRWLGTRGFSLNGGVVLVAVAIGVYIRRERLSLRYLDVVAIGFALGLAVGRIGDVINGEHYGPPSDFLLAVRNTHPEALTPSPAVAFHSGGLYGVLLGAAIFALLWPLRHRFRRPTMLLWAGVSLYAVGRFVESFFRLDSGELALGLSGPQWTSVVLLLVAGGGALWSWRRYGRGAGEPGDPERRHFGRPHDTPRSGVRREMTSASRTASNQRPLHPATAAAGAGRRRGSRPAGLPRAHYRRTAAGLQSSGSSRPR